MSWLQLTILLVFIGHSFGNSKPAVRVRVTQKGLNYAIDSAVEYAKNQLVNYPLPELKGSLPFDINYDFSNMTVYNINITNKSLRPVPKKGLYTVIRNMNFNVKGKWKISLASWFTNFGTFNVAVKDMSVAIHIQLGVSAGQLMISNVTCLSKLENIDINLKSGQATSFFFSLIKGTMTSVVKSKVPETVCKEGKKAIKKNLNEQFSKFPVKQHLKKSVTLDYSIVKKPEYKLDAVDLFLKGDFQPSNGRLKWLHQPADLPRDNSRDRMMYVTIMDHMINSVSHAYYNQNTMSVKVTLKQTPKLLPTVGIFGGVISRINAGIGLLKQSACANCDLHVSMVATSPPKINTSSLGIHLIIRSMATISVVLPSNVKESLELETNVTATVIPKLNGTNLSTNVTDIRISTRVVNRSTLTTLSGRVEEIKKIVKKKIEKFLENGISAMEIPLPLSEKFQLVKPKISYGEGYMILESDISII